MPRAFFTQTLVSRGEYGPAADVWSAGVMMYVLLAGHAPFDGDREELVGG